MSILKSNNRGSVLLIVVLFLLVTAIITIACFVAFGNFTMFTQNRYNKVSTGYMLESGIQHGMWRVSNYKGLPAEPGVSTSFTIPIDSVNVDVKIDCISLSPEKYTISSTYNEKTITATWERGGIVSWD